MQRRSPSPPVDPHTGQPVIPTNPTESTPDVVETSKGVEISPPPPPPAPESTPDRSDFQSGDF